MYLFWSAGQSVVPPPLPLSGGRPRPLPLSGRGSSPGSSFEPLVVPRRSRGSPPCAWIPSWSRHRVASSSSSDSRGCQRTDGSAINVVARPDGRSTGNAEPLPGLDGSTWHRPQDLGQVNSAGHDPESPS